MCLLVWDPKLLVIEYLAHVRFTNAVYRELFLHVGVPLDSLGIIWVAIDNRTPYWNSV